MIHKGRKKELALYSVNTLLELLEDLGLDEETFFGGSCLFTPFNIKYNYALNCLKNELTGEK
jgi:hypothetical protein